MKVVLDTNVLVSGLAYPNTNPGRIVAAWDSHILRLSMSHFQLNEISRVFGYPKIRKLLGWDDKRIESFVRQLELRVELVEIEDTTATVSNDPNDAPILATLIASSADVLITGDSDALRVH
ncbi:putative toxin-antitoxin system toxin component, PIN family [Candidatus Thiosymbion oneisti]|uniref:putative toxin-antitoxin system toxin component, PIN family n=1 Tax=Candidatus Thiosymbion oneisti TaxID=589554 RepID=UPI000B80022A|nr:putative toxin-antitoxin system toxin component, PIN family [Candidatus Thiosymbion oneisti]